MFCYLTKSIPTLQGIISGSLVRFQALHEVTKTYIMKGKHNRYCHKSGSAVVCYFAFTRAECCSGRKYTDEMQERRRYCCMVRGRATCELVSSQRVTQAPSVRSPLSRPRPRPLYKHWLPVSHRVFWYIWPPPAALAHGSRA